MTASPAPAPDDAPLLTELLSMREPTAAHIRDVYRSGQLVGLTPIQRFTLVQRSLSGVLIPEVDDLFAALNDGHVGLDCLSLFEVRDLMYRHSELMASPVNATHFQTLIERAQEPQSLATLYRAGESSPTQTITASIVQAMGSAPDGATLVALEQLLHWWTARPESSADVQLAMDPKGGLIPLVHHIAGRYHFAKHPEALTRQMTALHALGVDGWFRDIDGETPLDVYLALHASLTASVVQVTDPGILAFLVIAPDETTRQRVLTRCLAAGESAQGCVESLVRAGVVLHWEHLEQLAPIQGPATRAAASALRLQAQVPSVDDERRRLRL